VRLHWQWQQQRQQLGPAVGLSSSRLLAVVL
jgi:hypothetical protein